MTVRGWDLLGGGRCWGSLTRAKAQGCVMKLYELVIAPMVAFRESKAYGNGTTK